MTWTASPGALRGGSFRRDRPSSKDIPATEECINKQHVYMHRCTCMYLLGVSANSFLHLCTCLCTHRLVRIYIYMYIYIQIHTWACSCMSVRICVHVHGFYVHIHAHMQTHLLYMYTYIEGNCILHMQNSTVKTIELAPWFATERHGPRDCSRAFAGTRGPTRATDAGGVCHGSREAGNARARLAIQGVRCSGLLQETGNRPSMFLFFNSVCLHEMKTLNLGQNLAQGELSPSWHSTSRRSSRSTITWPSAFQA